MQYAKLIKHPLPPIKPEYYELLQTKYSYERFIYQAEILDGVLAVTIFQMSISKNQAEIDSRHFYDGERYATQRASDNKRLNGALPYYTTYNGKSIDNADEIIENYLKKVISKKEYNKLTCHEGLTTLYYVEQNMLAKALELRHKKITDKVDQRMAVLPENPPQEFKNWVEDWVLQDARYFFYSYKKRKTQKGICSHCQTTFEASCVKHNAEIKCPSCGSMLTCKSQGKTPQTIFDWVDAAYIEEITENGNQILVERLFNVEQRIIDPHEGVSVRKSIRYDEVCRKFFYANTFEPTEPESVYTYGYFRRTSNRRWCNIHDSSTSNLCESPKIFPKNLNRLFKNSSIPKIQNIEVSAITPYCMIDFRKLVIYLQKMPVLENFAKLGFYHLLQGIVDKYLLEYEYRPTAFLKRFITMDRNTVYETLGIPKDTMKRLGNIYIDDYILYKHLEKLATIKMDVFKRYVDLGVCKDDSRYDALAILQDHKISTEKFIGYLEKQCKLLKEKGKMVLRTYRDYLSMVKDLKLPKTESVLFPKNVNVEHDRVMKIKTDKIYKAQNTKLKKRAKILETLSYENEEFLIRPLMNSSDFLNESSVLNHCVKTYIDRCARGETNIFGIRKASDPETPYFTLQLSNEGKVITNLGKNNCQPPKEVINFVRKWKRKVIAKNKEKFIEAASNKPQKVKVTA